MIHLFLCSSFTNPMTLVGDTVVKVAQVIIKPARVWKRCKKRQPKIVIKLYQCFLSIRPSMIFKYILWSLQGPSLTVMSSMAINPSLVVSRWAANISCGWMFTLLHYAESIEMFYLMRSRNRFLHIRHYYNRSPIICFTDVTFLGFFLMLLSVVNPVPMTGHFFIIVHYYKSINDLLGLRKNKNSG